MDGKIIFAAVALSLGTSALITIMLKPPPPPPVARAEPAPKKEDRIEESPGGSRFVRTIPITRQPPPIVTAVPLPREEEHQVVKEEEEHRDLKDEVVRPRLTHIGESNVCARYGGHRVDYGKRWRCVYDRGNHDRRRQRRRQ